MRTHGNYTADSEHNTKESKMFQIIEKNGRKYRKNINPDGRCKHHQNLKCVCCNPECDYNCSIDDELEEQMEEIWKYL